MKQPKQRLGFWVYITILWAMYFAMDIGGTKTLLAVFDESGKLTGDIPDILTDCGISNILQIDEIFAMEFCDDCGTPLFADRDAELVHPEMPDDTPSPGTAHFH